ncbi:unannotated protein [freshwater metagenome]|uniref:Unannotated protein n=1 Tax=freshwater metagenome TaxID=449393 RepID=A0A6J6FJ42_9ZZZZ
MTLGLTATLGITSSQQLAVRDLLLYNLTWALSIALVITAPLSVNRLAISSLSLAILIWGVGSLMTSLYIFYPTIEPITWLPSASYLLFYPLAILATSLLVGKKVRLSPVEYLDAVILMLGMTSIIATLLYIALFEGTSFESISDYLNLFYAIADVVLINIGTFNLLRNGVTPRSIVFIVGVSTFVATDFYYLWLELTNRYFFGSYADIGWLIALFLCALSLHLPDKRWREFKEYPAFLTALAVFLSPVSLAISALRPDLIPRYLLAPAIANLLLAFIRMNTALREARILNYERLLAHTDELTGLPNRRKLIAEIGRLSDSQGSLMLLDLNDFKPINDRFGHEAGDQILREVARRLSRSLPHEALLARLGGDEFGVITHSASEDALECAYALQASLSYPFLIRGEKVLVGVSIGVVHNDGLGDLLKRADEAMYSAKTNQSGVTLSSTH